MKLGLAIEELHRSEQELAERIAHLREQHADDHEVFHVTRDLLEWSRRHLQELAAAGQAYDLELDPAPGQDARLLSRARERASQAVGRRPEPSLVMLRDLREVYVQAAGVSVDWELLAQAAQGARHLDLLGMTERCHPETLRQMRWANSRLKTSSTQALIS